MSGARHAVRSARRPRYRQFRSGRPAAAPASFAATPAVGLTSQRSKECVREEMDVRVADGEVTPRCLHRACSSA